MQTNNTASSSRRHIPAAQGLERLHVGATGRRHLCILRVDYLHKVSGFWHAALGAAEGIGTCECGGWGEGKRGSSALAVRPECLTSVQPRPAAGFPFRRRKVRLGSRTRTDDRNVDCEFPVGHTALLYPGHCSPLRPYLGLQIAIRPPRGRIADHRIRRILGQSTPARERAWSLSRNPPLLPQAIPGHTSPILIAAADLRT